MNHVNFIIAFAFLAAAIVNLIGPPGIRAEFTKWGYPGWFRVAVATIELIGSVLLVVSGAQWLGASILLVLTLGILASFARSKEWMRMQYPLVLLLLLATMLK